MLDAYFNVDTGYQVFVTDRLTGGWILIVTCVVQRKLYLFNA